MIGTTLKNILMLYTQDLLKNLSNYIQH